MARHFGHDLDEVLVDDDSLGQHPWDPTHPIVLDMSAAVALGYVSAGDYAATLAAEIDWLVQEHPSIDDAFFEQFFDYAAENRYLADR